MTVLFRYLLYGLLLAGLVSCAGKPVRHLTSDASLITVGSSTKEDVLTFLGDPDEQEILSSDSERWVYYEERRSTLQRAPLVGDWFGKAGFSRIVVRFDGNTVAECIYQSREPGEFDWADDYSWQEELQP